MSGGSLPPIPQPKPWPAKQNVTSSALPPRPQDSSQTYTSTPSLTPDPRSSVPLALQPNTPLILPLQVVSRVLNQLLENLKHFKGSTPLKALHLSKSEKQQLRQTLQAIHHFLLEWGKQGIKRQQLLQTMRPIHQVLQTFQDLRTHPLLQEVPLIVQLAVVQQTLNLLKQAQKELTTLQQTLLTETWQVVSLTQGFGLDRIQEIMAQRIDHLQQKLEIDNPHSQPLSHLTEIMQHPLLRQWLPFIPGLIQPHPQSPWPENTKTQTETEKNQGSLGLMLFIETEYLGRFHISIEQWNQTQLIFEILYDRAHNTILPQIEAGLIKQLSEKGFPRPLVHFYTLNDTLSHSSENQANPKTAIQLLQPKAIFLVTIAQHLADWIHTLDKPSSETVSRSGENRSIS